MAKKLINHEYEFSTLTGAANLNSLRTLLVFTTFVASGADCFEGFG
jgi:hypothetical protein